MSKTLQRLEKLRAKLHRQAELLVQRTQADLLASEAARDTLHSTMAAPGAHSAGDLQHSEGMREHLLRAGVALTTQLTEQRHALRERARDFKQIEKIVADHKRQAEERAAHEQERLVESWLRAQLRRRGEP